MIFTSAAYAVFLTGFFGLYWAIRARTPQNVLLLVAGYVFYGYVHPWFCILLAASTVADYAIARAIGRWPERRRRWLVVSLVFNLGLLGTFKYFNFFVTNVHDVLTAAGLDVSPVTLRLVLPVGISFYTFQSLSYVIDVYRGKIGPVRSFLDYAVFVSFFPQLVAGPIERANHLLPQFQQRRTWSWQRFSEAWPLLIRGVFKKVVVADSVAIYADQVYSLAHPTTLVLFAGTLAFAVQIVCDFSGYTDMARGSAKLIGFDLTINFDRPYLAHSPSDFWRRWHISFSSWIRDYVYIPLGGSRVSAFWFPFVLIASMGLSGLWHGAAWNYVLWGVYHGVILYAYHLLGMGGRWRPTARWRLVLAWFWMFQLTLVGWMLFRTTSVTWLWDAMTQPTLGLHGDSLLVAATITGLVVFYAAALLLLVAIESITRDPRWRAIVYGLMLGAIVVLRQGETREFIYFHF